MGAVMVWGTGCQTGHLDKSDCGTVNSGGSSGKQQSLAGEHLKSEKNEIQTTGNRDQRKYG
jgi:hypothetical protein